MRISDWSSDVCSSDLYIEGKLLGDDAALDAALAANHAGGLPAIDVSAVQGRFLHLLALAGRAARILEVGPLGGSSTLELARGLFEAGRAVTLEIKPPNAEVAGATIHPAGRSLPVGLLRTPA